MSDESTSNDERLPAAEAATERAFRELFAHAAPRRSPPEVDAAEIRAAVFAEWDRAAGRRVRWRRLGAGLAAAAVLSAVAIAWWQRPGGAGAPEIAAVERVRGAIEVGGQRAGEGDSVRENDLVSTGAGQVALRLAGGGSLRLAAETRARFTGPDAAQLLSGALYFDSEAGTRKRPFTVRTDVGTLRDVGTQFMARLESGRLEVGVRRGRVALTHGGARSEADAGERLTIPRDGDRIERRAMPTYGDEWAWVERLAPSFDIDGRHLADFLTWVEAQTGRRVTYADPQAERVARDSLLMGSIDLPPMPKLKAVLALTDLSYSLDGDEIVISTP
jgi:FecR protein